MEVSATLGPEASASHPTVQASVGGCSSCPVAAAVAVADVASEVGLEGGT